MKLWFIFIIIKKNLLNLYLYPRKILGFIKIYILFYIFIAKIIFLVFTYNSKIVF